MGKNEPDKARKSVENSVVLIIVSSLLLCVLYLIFSNQIIAMFGGTVNAETIRHSKEYFFYISLGIPFYMFGQAMNPIIRADGNPKFAVLNIILGPIFIFVFGWGMMGAAVATVIVGRCAEYFLKDKADCLNVFIHASMEHRAERIVKEYGVREESPMQRLKDKDKRRAAYHRFYTDMK